MKKGLKKTLQAALLASSLIGVSAFATAAPPGPPPACSTSSDLIGVTVFSCSGFIEGNLINTAAAADAATALAALPFASDGHAIALASVSGTTLHFADLLSGPTVIGLHIGGGSDGHVTESTAFYYFDAGMGTHDVDTRFTSLSNGGLYMTTPVPEPETYGMLLAGMGILGFVLRRKMR